MKTIELSRIYFDEPFPPASHVWIKASYGDLSARLEVLQERANKLELVSINRYAAVLFWQLVAMAAFVAGLIIGAVAR